MTKRYTTGTRNSVKNSELVKPPMITVPIDLRNSAPSVIPSASGIMPAIIATVVMTIGRKRIVADSRIASTSSIPRARSVFA